MKAAKNSTTPVITVNRKARYDYHLRDRYEAGIVLQGTEVKSIRAGRFNLADSYAQITDGEIFLIDAHIGAVRTWKYRQSRAETETETPIASTRNH